MVVITAADGSQREARISAKELIERLGLDGEARSIALRAWTGEGKCVAIEFDASADAVFGVNVKFWPAPHIEGPIG